MLQTTRFACVEYGLISVPFNPLEKKAFRSLENEISEETLKAVDDMGFVTMTHIQERSIPFLLGGRLVISCSQVTVIIINRIK